MMARYQVTVEMTQTKTISVYARDEEAAKEKAEEIVGAQDAEEVG